MTVNDEVGRVWRQMRTSDVYSPGRTGLRHKNPRSGPTTTRTRIRREYKIRHCNIQWSTSSKFALLLRQDWWTPTKHYGQLRISKPLNSPKPWNKNDYEGWLRKDLVHSVKDYFNDTSPITEVIEQVIQFWKWELWIRKQKAVTIFCFG